MRVFHASRVVVTVLVLLQVCGPSLLWALEQRGVEVRRPNRAVVSALRGSDLTVTTGETTTAVRFSESIPFGAPVKTARDSAAEVLINNQAVVTLLSESDVTLEERDGNTVVHLQKGSVLVSAAASALREGQTVIVETPGAQLATRGGLLKATVGPGSRHTEMIHEAEARARLVSYSIRPVQTDTMLTERFEVYEGTGRVGIRTAGATPLVIEAGQSVQMIGGIVGTPSGLGQATVGNGPVLLAVTQHAGTPQTGIDLVSQRQMQQVKALQQALFGDPDAQAEGKESERGLIIATLFGQGPQPSGSGQTTQSSRQTSQQGTQQGGGSGSGGSGGSGSGGIVGGGSGSGSGSGGSGGSGTVGGGGPVVGDGSPSSDGGTSGGGNTTTPVGPGPSPTQNLFANLFGNSPAYLAALLTAISRPGSGIGDDKNDAGDDLKVGAIEAITVKGGPGLLLFTEAKFDILVGFGPENESGFTPPISEERTEKTTINAVSELLRVQGGEPTAAPHGGLPPQETLIVRGLSAKYPGTGSPQEIADNRALPLQYSSSGAGFGVKTDGRLNFPARTDGDAAKNGVIAMQGESVLVSVPVSVGEEPFARTFDTSATVPTRLGLFSSQPDGAISFDNANRSGDLESFVDASITARSPRTGDRLVTLLGGVVLDKGTTITIGTTDATEKAFQKVGGAFNGSVLAVLADEGNPAFVRIQDRALGVVDGSRINGSGNVALLSVLDSRLIGPTATVEGRKNGEIPPLLELSAVDLEGKASGPRSEVLVKSAVVVRSSGAVSFGALDGPLLEASSPILTLANSQMTTENHLIDLAGRGPNGQPLLSAKLIPTDALVKLDRGSVLTVNGNLLNLANGASANVNGYLFSIANGSSLTLNGTLFSLEGNSILRLTSDAFGIFVGEGTNTLKLANNLCTGGTCGVLTDHLGQEFQHDGQPIRVSGVGGGTVALPAEFVPFKSPGGVAPNLEILPEAALFHVELGSELHINNVLVVPAVRP